MNTFIRSTCVTNFAKCREELWKSVYSKYIYLHKIIEKINILKRIESSSIDFAKMTIDIIFTENIDDTIEEIITQGYSEFLKECKDAIPEEVYNFVTSNPYEFFFLSFTGTREIIINL